jgi:hypothetical protein
MNTIKKVMASVFIVGLMLTTTSPALAFHASSATRSSTTTTSHASTSASSSSASSSSSHASASSTSTHTSAISAPSASAIIGSRPTAVVGPVAQGPSLTPNFNSTQSNQSNGPIGTSIFTINPATNVTPTTADFNLNYVISGCDANTFGVDVKFVYDTTPILNYMTSPSTTFTNFAAGSGPYTTTVSGLTPATTYYYGILGNGCQFTYTSGSQIQNFTTLGSNSIGASSFIVDPATAVTQTSATLNMHYVISSLDASNNNGVGVKFVYDTTASINYMTSPSTAVVNIPSGTGSFTANITGLAPNTTYYYRILGNGFQFTYVGNAVQSFTTSTNPLGAPIMTTTTASNVTNTTATLNGTYNANNAASTIWFEYGTTPALGNSTSAQSVSATSASSYNAGITGLTANTTYYFRAVGQNASGTSYASILSFSTTNSSSSSTSTGGGGGGGSNSVPDITTVGAEAITDVQATLDGHYNANGLATRTWFEISKDNSLVANNTAPTVGTANEGTGMGDFHAVASNLIAGTTYYYRAVAENTRGTVFGTIKSFTTVGTPQNTTDFTTLTSLATGVNISGATLNGVVQNGNHQAISAWFEYGTNVNALTQSTSVKSLGSGTVIAMSDTVSGLPADTTYYFRAVAQGATGISRGDVRFFITHAAIDQNTPAGGPVVPATTVTGENSKFISLTITDQSDVIAPGDAMNYVVSFKNKTNQDLENTVLEIALPNEITFTKASEGQFDSATNTLVVNVGTLGANIEGKITIDAEVSRDAAAKDFLLTNALLKYANPDTKVSEEAIAYVVNQVDRSGANSQGAASIFGDSGFFPHTVVGWLSLLLVLAGLVFIGRHLYVGRKRKQYAPDNLPQ